MCSAAYRLGAGRLEAHPLRESRPQVFVEDAERVGPEAIERLAHLRVAAEPVEPHLGVHAVIDLLAIDLRSEAGDLRVGVLLERLDPDRVRRLVQIVPSDRRGPVRDEPQLHELRRAVLGRLPVEGELVCGRPEVPRRELVQRPRVADLVLRDRREGDVLLKEGRDPRPLGVAPTEDQLVVSQAEQQLLVHAPPSGGP